MPDTQKTSSASDEEIFNSLETDIPQSNTSSPVPEPSSPETVTASELVPDTENSPPESSITPPPASEQPAKRGRGRHSKGCTCGNCKQSAGSPSVIGAAPSNVVPMIIEPGGTDYMGLSGMIFDTSTNALAIGFGDEWKPRTPDERENVCKALAQYLKAKEVKDIPPGMMLTIVVCAYAGPRFSQPSTKEKIRSGWTWIKSKLPWKKKAA